VQSGKLKPKEEDWNLPGTSGLPMTSRTCHGGQGRPCFDYRFVEVEDSSEEEDTTETPEVVEDNDLVVEEEEEEEDVEDLGSGDDEDNDDDAAVAVKKPPATRVVLEVGPMTDMLQKNW
jgi:hypothetical protein